MLKIVKLSILLTSFLFCLSAYSAHSSEDENISKALADSAKKSLLGEKGEFPITIGGDMKITNISSNNNIVVFEYEVPTDSQSQSMDGIVSNIKVGLHNQFCDKQDVIDVLNTYDIHFLFRFFYRDNRIVPALLSINEICE